MIPARVTDAMVLMFGSPLSAAIKRTFAGPAELPDCDPCEAIVHRSSADPNVAVVRVPLDLEDDDLEKLQTGGRVWLTMWGGLAPFSVEVVEGPDPVTPPEVFTVTTMDKPDLKVVR